nr:FAD:protein FMN transferase [Teredinibacter purpureus]
MRVLFPLLLCVLHALSSTTYASWHTDSQSIMGTKINITVWLEDPVAAQKLLQQGMTEMRRIDASFSPWIESSELARVNRLAAQQPQSISEELVWLIDKSLYFSHISEGAFDITFASVGWFYNYREKEQPTNEQRQTLLPAINYKGLVLDKATNTVGFTHENVRIDLGGIAKGYAVDRVAELLIRAGVKHATVSAGGDSRIIGDKRGQPWMIGIKNPRSGEQGKTDTAIVLPLENLALSTSGDYERYFIDEKTGKRVHHIINPKTGTSVEGVTSVTILGPTGSDTDPLSTTVFVLGIERGLLLINRLPGFDAVIIDSRGKVYFSEGLAPPAEPD